MTAIALGLVGGVGLLLIAAPFLWPASGGVRRGRLPSLVADRLAQAGLDRVPVGVFAVVSVLLGLGVAATVFALIGVVPAAVAGGLVAAALPSLAVGWRASALRRANRVVWPDVVDHLVSAVRAGRSLPDGIVALATSGPEQTRPAFARFARDYESTARFGDALDELQARLADPVADRLVETLRMAREVGGTELPTVLRNLSSYLRQDEAVRSELEARQSWVKGAARLGVAAPWVVLGMLSLRPEAAAAYNTPGGVALVAGGLGVTVLAYRLMLRVGRLPEEQRWRT